MSGSNIVNSTRIEILMQDNHDAWCVQAESSLVKNDGWNYVNGDIPKPAATDEDGLKKWKRADRKDTTDILMSITPNIAK